MNTDQPKAPIAYRRCIKAVGTNRRCRSLVFDRDAIFCPRHVLSQSSPGDVLNHLINKALRFQSPRGFQNSLKALYCLVGSDVISSRRANALVSITRMMMRNLEAAEKDNRFLPREDFSVPEKVAPEQVAPTAPAPAAAPALPKKSPSPQLPSPPIAASHSPTPPPSNASAAPAPLPPPSAAIDQAPQANASAAPLPTSPLPLPSPSPRPDFAAPMPQAKRTEPAAPSLREDVPADSGRNAQSISSHANLPEPTPPTNAQVDQIVDQLNRASTNPKEFADQIFQLTDRVYPTPRRFEGRVRSEARDPYG